MRNLIAATMLALAVSLTVALPAVTAHAGTDVNWRERTCAAAQAYASHPSRARLETLVVDSFHVTPKYLGADVGQLYADVEGGGSKYVAKDLAYIRSDCKVW